MRILLYNTEDEVNVLNKTLTDETEYKIKVKRLTSVQSPIIRLRSDTYINFNYAYIPTFDRYYYIEKTQVFPNHIYELTLRCDVLKSYEQDILNSEATIISDDVGNSYINDGYTKEVKKNVSYTDFQQPFLDLNNPEYIMITAKINV